MAQAEDLLKRILTVLVDTKRNKKCIGKQVLTVTSASAVTLTVPDYADTALIVVEDGGGSDTTKSIRFWEDGSTPTASQGYPLGNLDSYEITGHENVVNFEAIGIEGGISHTVTILYYSL